MNSLTGNAYDLVCIDPKDMARLVIIVLLTEFKAFMSTIVLSSKENSIEQRKLLMINKGLRMIVIFI